MCEGTNTPRLQWQIPAGDWVCPDGVAMEDLDYFAIRWLMADCAASGDCDGADLDGDGAVDLADWAVFAEQWLGGIVNRQTTVKQLSVLVAAGGAIQKRGP